MNQLPEGLTVELVQETLISLRERQYTLTHEHAISPPVIRAIVEQQLNRVTRSIRAFEQLIGEQA